MSSNRVVHFILNPPMASAIELGSILNSIDSGIELQEQKAMIAEEIRGINRSMMLAVGSSDFDIKTVVRFPSNSHVDRAAWLQNSFGADVSKVWSRMSEAHSGPLAVSDHLLCFTLPLWINAAIESGWKANAVLFSGGAVETALELGSVGSVPFDRGLHLWSRYLVEAIEKLPGNAIVTSADALLQDPKSICEALSVDVSPSRISALKHADCGEQASWKRFAHLPRTTLINRVERLFVAAQSDVTSPDVQASLPSVKHIVRMLDEETGNVFRIDQAREMQALPSKASRKVIYHCHIFKNAGTSIDHILQSNFPEKWKEQEFETHDLISNSDQVRSFIASNPHVEVLSSHTGNWRLGYDRAMLEVFPIVFVRHPILRILSAYKFERQQEGTPTYGASLAKENDFNGYVAARLNNPIDNTFRNYQSRRLAFFTGAQVFNLAEQSQNAVKQMNFVGLVEKFDQSIERLEDYLKPHFPEFRSFHAQKNVTQKKPKEIEAQLADIEAALDSDLHQVLWDENRLDVGLFELVSSMYK